MFGFLKKLRKKKLSFEQLRILQLIAQQVVLSVEGSVKLPGADKKAVALELTAKILEEIDLVAPGSLVDAMLESAVSILKAVDRALEKEAKPNFSFDISGRPKSGN